MINNTTLVGRLTKNIELKYTAGGIAVANFTLAVERNFKNKQGEQVTDFINCVIWRESAETLSSFAVRGSLIGIVGSIETGSYEKNGQTVYTTTVNADNFQMLEPKEVNDKRREQAGVSSGSGSGVNSRQGNQSGVKERFSGNSGIDMEDNPFETIDNVSDISDDDLPF